MKAPREPVVAREIEVDQDHLARRAHLLLSGRRGLQQHARNLARLDQQKHADLRHVRAGGDVHPVLLVLQIERVTACPVVQRAIHLAKVPRVLHVGLHQAHLRLWRHVGDVGQQHVGERCIARRVEQLQAVDDPVFMLDERHRGPPLAPAPCALPGVELRAHETDDDVLLGHIQFSKFLALILVTHRISTSIQRGNPQRKTGFINKNNELSCLNSKTSKVGTPIAIRRAQQI